jgi:hypothetical protein
MEDKFCKENKCFIEINRHFSAFSPSPEIISFVFTTTKSSPGPGHDASILKSASYDLKTARELTLDDVFIDPKKSISLLWPTIAERWCEHDHNSRKTFPRFYKLPDGANNCAKVASVPLPDQLKAPPYTFEKLGFAYLTPRGLTLELTGPLSWGPDSAIFDLNLDRNLLLKIGAKPEVWPTRVAPKQVPTESQAPKASGNFGPMALRYLETDVVSNGFNPDTYKYAFLLDLSVLHYSNFKEISKIIIRTDKGDIIFDSVIHKDIFPRFIVSYLTLPEEIGNIVITDSLANIDGNLYSVNEYISAGLFSQTPLEININNYVESENKICASKILDLGTLEGIYVGPPDPKPEGVVVKVKVKGEDLAFLFDQGLDYFFYDEANVGTGIKFHFKVLRTKFYTSDSDKCDEVKVITHLLSLN